MHVAVRHFIKEGRISVEFPVRLMWADGLRFIGRDANMTFAKFTDLWDPYLLTFRASTL